MGPAEWREMHTAAAGGRERAVCLPAWLAVLPLLPTVPSSSIAAAQACDGTQHIHTHACTRRHTQQAAQARIHTCTHLCA